MRLVIENSDPDKEPVFLISDVVPKVGEQISLDRAVVTVKRVTYRCDRQRAAPAAAFFYVEDVLVEVE